MLEDEGIVITTAAAVDMEKVLAKTNLANADDIPGLKYLIAPLLCRNKEDQDKLYKVFDKLKEKIQEGYVPSVVIEKPAGQDEIIEIKKPDKPGRKWYLKNLFIPALFILVLLTAVYFLLRHKTGQTTTKQVAHKINIISTPQQPVLNDTVQFNAVTDSSVKPESTTVDWKFSDTLISNQLSVTKIIHDSVTAVTAFLKDKKGSIIDSANSTIIALCEPPPSVDINETDIATNSLNVSVSFNEKQFGPLFTNPSPDSAKYKYKWFVDDSLYSQQKTFTYAKSYNKIKLVVDCKGVHCSTDSLVAQIESTPALNVAVTGNGNLRIESTYNWTSVLLSILLLLILPCIIAFITYRFIRSFKAFTPEIEETQPGTEGPYKIEFVPQQQSINGEQGINKLADVLRKRQVSDIYKLNIRKTIRSTVIAGGIPALQFTPLSKPLSFLAFIDKENADSHLVKLFEYLVEKLRKEEVNIVVYSYEKEPLFLSNEKLNQERIPLEKIAALYPGTTLFIFGNAQYFLYPLKGTTKSWVTRKLNNWPTKILITPYTVLDWDKKEKLLIDANFVVLPADLSSVVIIDKIISRQIDITAQKKEHIESSYRSRFINFQDFDTLKAYINDKYLLQWVCSLAIYPAIDWNFTIAMGKAIEQQLQQSGNPAELVNYSNLLKIARISWMQDGIINESLRVQMLAYLDKDEEALARKTLSKQLKLIESTISKDSLVKTNFDIHTKLNNFLLDAYYNNKTSNADDAFIKKLIENNQLDEGQDIYLSKGDNTLLHHPSNKKNAIGIRDYFKSKLSMQKIFSIVCGLIMFAGLALLAFAILKNYTSYLTWYSVKPSAQNYTVNIQGDNFNKQVNFDLYYEPAHTRWRSQQINLANTNFSFKYDSVVLKDTLGYGVIKLSTADGKLITQDSFKLNSSAYTINIKEAPKTSLYIFYRNDAGLAIANSLSEKLPLNFNIQIAKLNSFDSNSTRVGYFSKQYEKEALSAVNVLNAFLNKKIENPQLMDSFTISSKYADVIIFINEAAKCTPLAITALPQSLNEIWHGGTSNRLVNIDLKRKVIYYSTSDPKTYGSYSIYSVCLGQSGAYKIITKANGGFNVFFIKNVTQNSFDFSVCETIRSKTAAEIENMDESYCDHFNTMTLYYENGNGTIFYPIADTSLNQSQIKKFNMFSNTYTQNNSTQVYRITHYAGMFYLEKNLSGSILSKYQIKWELGDLKKIANPSPFQRDYDIFSAVDMKSYNNQSYTPDCSKVFYSISETQKLESPLIVCKLDLSQSQANLTALPNEIYSFKNLRDLYLGTTFIPEADINALQKALPNCKITYSRSANPTTQNANEPINNNQSDNNAVELGLIILDEKGGLNSTGGQLVNAIAKQLSSNKQSIVKFEATYTNKQQYSVIYDGLKTITNMLLKSGAAASQVQQSVTEIKQQQLSKEPSKQSKSSYTNIIINVSGVNFPGDFNTQQKSAY